MINEFVKFYIMCGAIYMGFDGSYWTAAGLFFIAAYMYGTGK